MQCIVSQAPGCELHDSWAAQLWLQTVQRPDKSDENGTLRNLKPHNRSTLRAPFRRAQRLPLASSLSRSRLVCYIRDPPSLSCTWRCNHY